MKDLISIVKISDITHEVVQIAIKSGMNDFEDAIQSASAKFSSIDKIITRNKKDYKNSSVDAVAPNEFIKNNDLRVN